MSRGVDRRHHIIPGSRGGLSDGSNLYRWKKVHQKKHDALHALFQNMMPAEIMAVLLVWEGENGDWNLDYFKVRGGAVDQEKVKRIKFLFDGMRPREAAEWIDKEFIRKDWD